MNQQIIKLSRSNLIRKTFRGLKLHRAYNTWLHYFPRKRENKGIVYRSRRTEGVSLALEMMEGGNSYPLELLPEKVSTVADIGCNVGYFACLLAMKYGKGIKGIMVDANPAVIEEAKWHINANRLKDMKVVHGIVGSDSHDFFIFEADTCSTAQLGPAQAPDMKRFHRIEAPLIDFKSEWTKHLGSSRCDVLKVDIEGSEMEFLRGNASFLPLVDNVFIEWHKYRVPFEEMDRFLKQYGLTFVKIIEDIGLNGTAFYKRQR
jgi:FkbM family methyltransferase